MQLKNFLLGVLGAAVVTLILVSVDDLKSGGCLIRATGESITISGCNDLEHAASVINSMKGFWPSLGHGGNFDVNENCC
ncbi:TGB3 [Grapevine foveavirus A]|uniref:Movement protein TGBp3 n=1 Tax=Grapevine foveavirus A TaxID=2763538 RepID=A0A7D5AWB1_9VIRU|nr:TGB3 [Grapevine foveavirus A]QKV50512.1 TGB3 [Grapevine foveavirus A]